MNRGIDMTNGNQRSARKIIISGVTTVKKYHLCSNVWNDRASPSNYIVT